MSVPSDFPRRQIALRAGFENVDWPLAATDASVRLNLYPSSIWFPSAPEVPEMHPPCHTIGFIPQRFFLLSGFVRRGSVTNGGSLWRDPRHTLVTCLSNRVSMIAKFDGFYPPDPRLWHAICPFRSAAFVFLNPPIRSEVVEHESHLAQEGLWWTILCGHPRRVRVVSSAGSVQ